MKNKIILSNEARLKMKYFVAKAPGEISGLCKSEIRDNGDVYVTDCIIFEQESSASRTIISDQAMAQFLTELVRAKDKPENWNIWWHSHGTMDVFWSKTDSKTIEDHTNQSYLISIVTNKKGEYKARLDIFPTDHSPFKQETFCTYDDLKIEEEFGTGEYDEQKNKIIEIINNARAALKEINELENENPEIKAWCESEIEKKLKNPVAIIPKIANSNFNRSLFDNRDFNDWGKKNENQRSKEEEREEIENALGFNEDYSYNADKEFEQYNDYYDEVFPEQHWYIGDDGLMHRQSNGKLLVGMI